MDIVGLKQDEVVGTYNGTWDGCYECGYRPPRFPVPATTHVSEIATEWASLEFCPWAHGNGFDDLPCLACLDKYMDSLEYDFPDAFNY